MIDQLGYYDTTTEPPTMKLDEEKAKMWIGRGAQPTDTTRSLLAKVGVIERGTIKQGTAKTQPEPKK